MTRITIATHAVAGLLGGILAVAASALLVHDWASPKAEDYVISHSTVTGAEIVPPKPKKEDLMMLGETIVGEYQPHGFINTDKRSILALRIQSLTWRMRLATTKEEFEAISKELERLQAEASP